MPYFNRCYMCGEVLDPGEKCECQKESKENEKDIESDSNNSDNGYVLSHRQGVCPV